LLRHEVETLSGWIWKRYSNGNNKTIADGRTNTMATQPTHKGLLGFLYEVGYDSQLNSLFHEQPAKVMNMYNLSPAVQQILNQLGQIPDQTAPARMPLIKQLTDQLAKELTTDELAKFW
jgi:hypothetical protein